MTIKAMQSMLLQLNYDAIQYYNGGGALTKKNHTQPWHLFYLFSCLYLYDRLDCEYPILSIDILNNNSLAKFALKLYCRG